MELIAFILWIIFIATLVKSIRKKATRFKGENDAVENQSISSSGNYKSKYQKVQSNPYDPSSEYEEALLWELQNNGKIRAIKLVREQTGYSLADAKTYVENLERSIPDRQIRTHQRFSEGPKEEDISSIDGMDGHEFEGYCAQLLKKNGFLNVSVTPGSGDQGVDVLATKDGIKYAIQCKNYASPLGNTPIQEVNAGKVFYNCHVGVVMTNSTFTPKAKELAQATGVLLWDRTRLQELIAVSNSTSQARWHKQEVPINQIADSTSQSASQQEPVPQNPIVQASVTPSPDVAIPPSHTAKPFFSSTGSASITENIEGVLINIHVSSASAVNLVLSNFGIDKDDDEPDELALLFDADAKDAHGILENITIVCNAFAGNYKLATEYGYLYKDSFDWKDSLKVYFDKKNLAKKTTRIDIFCKRG